MENIESTEETKRKFMGLIAAKFNIVLEESRLEDYEFRFFDPKKLNVEIEDTRTGAVYSSKIINEADILDVRGTGVKYNNWKMVSPRYKLEKLFHLSSKSPVISYKSPIVERLTFSEGEYDLVFEKQKPYHIDVRKNGISLIIKYVKRFECDGQVYDCDLLTRTYTERLIGENKGYSEHLCACAPSKVIPCDNSLDEETEVVKDSVAYTFCESVYPSVEENNHDILGICLENAQVDIINYLPVNFYCDPSLLPISHYAHTSSLNAEGTISGIIIYGGVDNYNLLEIHKTKECIGVRYVVSDMNLNVITNREFNISNQNLGTICPSEIAEVIGVLNNEYSDDEFIRLATVKLENFSERISIRKGQLREVCDGLDPKLLLYKTMGEIATTVLANKDAYFDLARSKFEKATSVNEEGTIGFQKTLIGPESK